MVGLNLLTQISVRKVRKNSFKPNLYASGRHPDMSETWLFVCSGKIKISYWAFLDGHPVKILKLLYQDMNQKCKTAQTNQIHFLQDLTQICTRKYNQLLNFPVHTKNYVLFISGWRPDAYRLGLSRYNAAKCSYLQLETLATICLQKTSDIPRWAKYSTYSTVRSASTVMLLIVWKVE